MRRTFDFAVLIFLIAGLWFQTPAYAACTGPAASGGAILYNSDHSVFQWCDGTDWIGLPKPKATGGKISAGGDGGGGTTCGIMSDGSAWCWGDNGSGDLGAGSCCTDQSSPTAVDISGSIPDTWKEIGAGGDVYCGLAGDGTIWCWGSCNVGTCGPNTGGQVSPVLATGTDTWQTFSANATVCALKSDDTLWCWGYNSSGQVGNGNTTDQSSPVQIAVGDTWKMVSTGLYHTCGIKSDDTAWCWGRNWEGELGDGSSYANSTGPVAVDTTGSIPDTWVSISVGTYHTCAIATDGSAWCWGRDTHGMLGDGGTASDQYLPVAVAGGGTWKYIAAGTSSTCGIQSDDSLWCWGLATNGQLGNGSTSPDQSSPVTVSGGYSWISVDLPRSTDDDLPYQACGVQTDGTAWCWGLGSAGERGDGSTTATQSIPVQVSGGGTWGDGPGADCSPGEAGEILYNSDNSVLQWCNGTYWIGLPGGGSGGAGCSSPAADPGSILYNSDYSVMQWCDGTDWIGFKKPCNLFPVGTTCADGSIYIGQVGGNDIYATDAASETNKSWNNGISNPPWTDTGFTSATDGPGNTAGLVALTDAGSPYQAAEYCDGLSAHGHTDWYLPAKDELSLFYNGGSPVAGVNTSGSWYWASTEFNSAYARIHRFSDGFQGNNTKDIAGGLVRCVRKD